MSFEWKKYSIADVSKKVVTGKTPPGTLEKYFGGDVLFVTPTDMGDNKYIERTQRTLSDEGEAKLAKQKFECGIVVSCIGWQMGKSAIVKNAAVTNQQINTIIPNNELIDVDFLYYILSDKRTEIFNLGATATRTPILKKSLFEKIEFYAPKLEQQKKIGSILSCLDNKIINNQKINQTLEQMANALFKSWFVDFEPVKAKVTVLQAGGSQEEATLAAMTAISGKDADVLVAFEREHPEQYAELKATAELFPSAMQESELGDIPEGWKPGCIGNISQRIRTKVGSSSAVVLSAVASGELVPSDEHFTKQVYSKSIEKYILVEQWSFAYNPSRINIGSIGLNVKSLNGAVSPVYVVFKTEPEYKWYVEILTKTTYFKSNVNILASGSVRQSLSYDDLASIPLCIPEVSIVNIFNEKYEEYLSLIEKYRNQNNTLVSIRDTLLPKLLSGEITLPEAEQAVSEVENV
ncbi:restriction endonuclease subunit S [Escherichia coli]|uniref:restriction endonuclease subunit S n=1 Tax=Escherichia coli TaxID=562 RepID=UPI0020C9C242|nr:restriction endonuclease subunit S [Escherichia coli]UTO46566.1 restriction endonuclease subunit S [Escherichia coli]